MNASDNPSTTARYALVARKKAVGATYTPKALADFVAGQLLRTADPAKWKGGIRVLDPAVGDGQLLASLLALLPREPRLEVFGFDTNVDAVRNSQARLTNEFPHAVLHLTRDNFLRFVLDRFGGERSADLPDREHDERFDLIIANPPYVRTQVLGSADAGRLSAAFELTGRVDLYHAFILGMAGVLRTDGAAAMIVSNRFMTTKTGAGLREAIGMRLRLRHVWDLGDTKLFDAAVLPAVLLAEGTGGEAREPVAFTSVYETRDKARGKSPTPIDALADSGVIQVDDGRHFRVRHGTLEGADGSASVWRMTTVESEAWLARVAAHTWRSFGSIGKIRVGVKTCADRVFIRDDWDRWPADRRPELLRPVTTHHVARRFRSDLGQGQRRIVYPHVSENGRRQVADLSRFPATRAYLEAHRGILEGRKYVLEAGRRWYEIWVPQDPAVWETPKVVLRDISRRPCFWIDCDGSVVNGDCYWMIPERSEDEDLLWMVAAVGNSTFIEAFYDHRFHNKLYAGRRRFITQYVETFPIPDPNTAIGEEIVGSAKAIYEAAGTHEAERMEADLNRQVRAAFGLDPDEPDRTADDPRAL